MLQKIYNANKLKNPEEKNDHSFHKIL